MRPRARTPEELEALFEDAFVIRDHEAVAQLFEDGAVLVADEGLQEARGPEEIAGCAAALWERDRTYLADPGRVFQARDTALVVTDGGIAVMRRGRDRTWRYAISILSLDHPTAGATTSMVLGRRFKGAGGRARGGGGGRGPFPKQRESSLLHPHAADALIAAGPPPATTVVFADLVGFTALAEVHGDGIALTLLDEFAAVLRRLARSWV